MRLAEAAKVIIKDIKDVRYAIVLTTKKFYFVVGNLLLIIHVKQACCAYRSLRIRDSV